MKKVRNLVEWSEELSVGIQEIDEQHKILVDLLNQLYGAIITRTDSSVIGDILDELTEYTIIHFAVEESLMRILDYPDYVEHKKQHEELANQVVDLKNKFKKNEVSIGMEMLNFLRNWLTKHILVEDKRYAPFMVAGGVKKSWTKQSWVGRIWHFGHK